MAGKDDVYLMAGALDLDTWILYSGAVRAQTECLAIAETNEPSFDDLRRLLVAYVRTDEARVGLASYFDGRQPTPHGIGNIVLTRQQICEVLLAKHNLRSRAESWADRLMAGAGSDSKELAT